MNTLRMLLLLLPFPPMLLLRPLLRCYQNNQGSMFPLRFALLIVLLYSRRRSYLYCNYQSTDLLPAIREPKKHKPHIPLQKSFRSHSRYMPTVLCLILLCRIPSGHNIESDHFHNTYRGSGSMGLPDSRNMYPRIGILPIPGRKISI